MKKSNLLFLFAALGAVTIFASCGGEEKEANAEPITVSEDAASSETTTTTEENTSSDETPTVASSKDCDEFIKDYEEYVESYVKVLKKYKANPTDMTIVSEYTEMAQKAAEMQTNAEGCNDAKYTAKLLALSNKIAQAAY